MNAVLLSLCVYPINDHWNHMLCLFAGVDHAEELAASEDQSVMNEAIRGHERLHALPDNHMFLCDKVPPPSVKLDCGHLIRLQLAARRRLDDDEVARVAAGYFCEDRPEEVFLIDFDVECVRLRLCAIRLCSIACSCLVPWDTG